MQDEELTRRVIGAAIEVHRNLGPGLLESVYRICMGFELENRGIDFKHDLIKILQNCHFKIWGV